MRRRVHHVCCLMSVCANYGGDGILCCGHIIDDATYLRIHDNLVGRMPLLCSLSRASTVVSCGPGFAEYHFSVCECPQCRISVVLVSFIGVFLVSVDLVIVTRPVSRICQGMSWQHLSSPVQCWKGAIFFLWPCWRGPGIVSTVRSTTPQSPSMPSAMAGAAACRVHCVP